MPDQPQTEQRSAAPPPSPPPAAQPAPSYYPPTGSLADVSLNEKSNGYSSPPPPPAYPPGPAVLSVATALYAYTPTDSGDLALQPNDRVSVLEHMNNDCTIIPFCLVLLMGFAQLAKT